MARHAHVLSSDKTVCLDGLFLCHIVDGCQTLAMHWPQVALFLLFFLVVVAVVAGKQWKTIETNNYPILFDRFTGVEMFFGTLNHTVMERCAPTKILTLETGALKPSGAAVFGTWQSLAASLA